MKGAKQNKTNKKKPEWRIDPNLAVLPANIKSRTRRAAKSHLPRGDNGLLGTEYSVVSLMDPDQSSNERPSLINNINLNQRVEDFFRKKKTMTKCDITIFQQDPILHAYCSFLVVLSSSLFLTLYRKTSPSLTQNSMICFHATSSLGIVPKTGHRLGQLC